MTLSRRAFLAAALPAGLLAGCGFRPLYGRGAVQAGLEQVQVASLPDRMGQMLRNDLIARINPRGEPVRPLYRLEVNLGVSRRNLVEIRNTTITEESVVVDANYRLIDTATNEPVFKSQTRATTSYPLDSTDIVLSNRASRDSAEQRALALVADDIVTALAAALDRGLVRQ